METAEWAAMILQRNWSLSLSKQRGRGANGETGPEGRF
jgi:hypothetical protein